MKKIIIGSRGSELALWQANFIKDGIEKNFNTNNSSRIKAEIKIVKTKGDKLLDTALSSIGDKGLFTKELEDKLIAGEIDMAVHSMKDVQTEIHSELEIACYTKRDTIEDVLIAREPGLNIFDLKDNAVVATGSLRRKSQLLHIRPDLVIVDLRGNINSRIEKFLKSDWDAIVLARAGVERLGLGKYISSSFNLAEILPAVGQGALGVEIRKTDSDMREILKPLNDEETQMAVAAERAFLKKLEGGCQVPIGAYAVVKSTGLHIDGLVAAPDGSVVYRKRIRGSKYKPELLGEELAGDLLSAGAGEILEQIRAK